MYTYCPECEAIFRITAETVGAADGRVRCGECNRVFNSLERLFDNPKEARYAAVLNSSRSLQAGGSATPPGTGELDENDVDEPGPLLTPLSGEGWAGRRMRRKDIAGGILATALLLLLGLQWVYFNLDTFARDETVRPLLEEVCGLLHCHLPLRVDLARLEIMDRDVRKHPQVADALLINATIRNRADFPQPYPVFEVSFGDVGGNPVAIRRFLPEEYLGEGSNTAAGMATGVPVHIVLELQDPGEKAVSFQFSFL